MADFFSNKHVWITGASSGIGEALARELAARGAYLTLCARRESVLNALREQLPNAEHHRVLVLDLAQPEALFEQVRAAAAGCEVDILINNGGISQRGRADETAFAVDRRVMEVNYLGSVAMTKALMPKLVAASHGVVATVASVSGLVGSQGRSAYSASKHALMGFMESLRAEMHGKLQVTVACPGWVHTQISVNSLTASGEPLGKMEPGIANGLSAEACARAFLHAIARGRDEIVIGKGISALAPTVKRFLPAVFKRMNRKRAYR
ncbi:SDR family oxidoreductase [Simiduia sp. 21SJ11W-1]|uniref:SDR family oxidoreductase n=1 Tax=Simiduia sp. 21SJ11W-1 TaxID=2909669 RepID=UPI00209F328B|nr:SDR family oxidoreductase [Simiduia sp. 21SJ11W-1]UTA46821.1 SDR family oxidoreductase [Simiduia sp. 21SJ11W-1]